MGHASPQAALIYQHASAERDRAIAAALSKLAEAEWRTEPPGSRLGHVRSRTKRRRPGHRP
ncbi:MAG: hypothetical protein ACYDEN_05460 [Acidimicrobiales bacterium]